MSTTCARGVKIGQCSISENLTVLYDPIMFTSWSTIAQLLKVLDDLYRCQHANMSAGLFDAFKVQSHKVYIKPIVMENPMLGQQPTYCKESKQPMLFISICELCSFVDHMRVQHIFGNCLKVTFIEMCFGFWDIK